MPEAVQKLEDLFGRYESAKAVGSIGRSGPSSMPSLWAAAGAVTLHMFGEIARLPEGRPVEDEFAGATQGGRHVICFHNRWLLMSPLIGGGP